MTTTTALVARRERERSKRDDDERPTTAARDDASDARRRQNRDAIDHFSLCGDLQTGNRSLPRARGPPPYRRGGPLWRRDSSSGSTPRSSLPRRTLAPVDTHPGIRVEEGEGRAMRKGALVPSDRRVRRGSVRARRPTTTTMTTPNNRNRRPSSNAASRRKKLTSTRDDGERRAA